jgi:hypothetical protein
VLPSCVTCCHLLLCASCMPSALWPPLSALCLMSLALCGPGWFYILFVSDIWCGSLPSCVICCHALHSGSLSCDQCMPSAICPPLSAFCLMSLDLCNPLWFYPLSVPDILCGVVPSCVICRHVLHSGSLLCNQCMPAASGHLPCVVLCGVHLLFVPYRWSGVVA